MIRRTLLAMAVLAVALPGGAWAQTVPANAKPLSEILRALEAGGDVVRFDEIEWDDGRWEIEYISRAGGKRVLKVDPVSGETLR